MQIRNVSLAYNFNADMEVTAKEFDNAVPVFDWRMIEDVYMGSAVDDGPFDAVRGFLHRRIRQSDQDRFRHRLNAQQLVVGLWPCGLQRLCP
ncbi:hypothetical protein NZK35_20745 [Stieleria sp. ICT_E10.1]|uniref:hypothetical protein n=1 Tax=Stieleria sedimenti TaxID=2976331 RepID=UPI00217FAFED|nr:hypothetical protein [Stieleria sedimenti]MCS7469088.1 hypothetical protein [Stieleria sedimenti]